MAGDEESDLSGARGMRSDQFFTNEKSNSAMTTHILNTADVDIAYDVSRSATSGRRRPALLHDRAAHGRHRLPDAGDALPRANRCHIRPERTGSQCLERTDGLTTRRKSRPETYTPSSRRSTPGRSRCSPAAAARSPHSLSSPKYPDDVTTLVAHEPPIIPVSPTARRPSGPGSGPRRRTRRRVERRDGGLRRNDVLAGRVHRRVLRAALAGSGHVRYAHEDDGTRDDPLLSDRSWAISSYRPDVDAMIAAPTRVVIAVGEESAGTWTGRTSLATAELLNLGATVLPSHRGGFLDGEFGYAGRPGGLRRGRLRRGARRRLTPPSEHFVLSSPAPQVHP